MNKSEFIEILSKELGTSKVEAGRYIDKVFKCIATSMKNNNELKFVGFGTFRAKQTEEKQVKTPRGDMAKVPAQRRISFSVGSEFKAAANNKQSK